MILAQIPEEGLPERQLGHQLGISPEETSRVRGQLLRRKMIRRDPPGASRAGSRLFITERGRREVRWLDRLETSLPEKLFESARSDGGSDLQLATVQSTAAPEPGQPAWRVTLRRWLNRPEPLPLGSGAYSQPEDESFEQGLVYVWIGTGLFVVAVLVGVLWGSEVAGLAALGVGVVAALLFLGLAAVSMIRGRRARRRREKQPRFEAPRPGGALRPLP